MTEKDIKRIQELKEELKKIADEGNSSKEDKEMMHVDMRFSYVLK